MSLSLSLDLCPSHCCLVFSSPVSRVPSVCFSPSSLSGVDAVNGSIKGEIVEEKDEFIKSVAKGDPTLYASLSSRLFRFPYPF